MHTTTICELLALLVLLLWNAVDSAYEGEVCFHSTKGVDGICKEIAACSDAISDLMKGIHPQNCGFVEKNAIICCPGNSSTATTTTSKPQPISAVGEKSRKACKSYEYLGYKEVVDPLESEVITEKVCPWGSGLTLIIGGPKAYRGEFPHMALIGYGTPDNYAWKCSGTLISENFVLTNAHCLFARGYGEPKFVRVGDLNSTDPTDDQLVQQLNIKRYYKHPDYKYPVNYHDIALLELEKSVKLSLEVKPACIYTNDSANVQTGIVTGWGTAKYGEDSDFLLKESIHAYSPTQCNKIFSNDRRTMPNGLDASSQICFASNTISCQGDSGGPLQRASDIYCSYDVFGIISFGKGCGTENIPAGYVKIYPYIDWIEKIVWP